MAHVRLIGEGLCPGLSQRPPKRILRAGADLPSLSIPAVCTAVEDSTVILHGRLLAGPALLSQGLLSPGPL